jgi:hypothetical protein
VRLRPTHASHVWSYDFVSTHAHDGRRVSLLNLIDEYTRECSLIRAERRWTSARVIEALAKVMVQKGVPVVETLRQCWVSQYWTDNGTLRWRHAGNLSPSSVRSDSPCDLDKTG